MWRLHGRTSGNRRRDGEACARTRKTRGCHLDKEMERLQAWEGINVRRKCHSNLCGRGILIRLLSNCKFLEEWPCWKRGQE